MSMSRRTRHGGCIHVHELDTDYLAPLVGEAVQIQAKHSSCIGNKKKGSYASNQKWTLQLLEKIHGVVIKQLS